MSMQALAGLTAAITILPIGALINWARKKNDELREHNEAERRRMTYRL